MQFPTVLFSIFFLTTLVLWWAVPWTTVGRTRLLIVASLVFYSATGWWWLGILLGVAGLTWAGMRWIDQGEGRGRTARGWTIVSVLVLHLAAWKYTHWVLDLGQQAWGWALELPHWAYPVGLSFFTFHGLALVASVWHKRHEPLSFQETLAQISFFPSLLAGPVLRASSIADRLKQPFVWRDVAWTQMVWMIALGMGFKWVLSTQAANMSDPVFQGMSESTLHTWWGVHAYAAQIFFDFAGYSLMAIGLAGLLGFVLPANFTQPYLATNAKEFWSSWHRSLSFFFRDHLYIDAFGGNSKGKWWAMCAAALTMLISGLWHGASVTFIVWGAWHAAWLVLERILPTRAQWPKWLGWLVSMQIVVWGWVWFRAENMEAAYSIFEQAFHWGALPLSSSISWEVGLWTSVGLLVIFSERFMLSWGEAFERAERERGWLAQLGVVVFLCVWAGIVIWLGPEGVPPFIYNGF